MSDSKYNVDDILKEISRNRSDSDDTKKSGSYNGSVTEIIDGNEVERALRMGVQKKKPAGNRTARQKSSEYGVTQIIDAVAVKKSARQLTEAESDERISRDISEAMSKRKPFERPKSKLAARQLTEDDSDMRIASDIGRAIDNRERRPLQSSIGSIDSFEEGVRDISRDFDGNFGDLDAADDSDVKTYNSPKTSDEDIIFHTLGDIVTTKTTELRKQKKIDDINEALLRIDSEANSPHDILDSINPMDSREKAQEIIKSESADEITDTLAVAGNDLKRIGKGEEHIKEYRPAIKRREPAETESAGAQKPIFPAEIHVGETIVEALNKKIHEQASNDGHEKTERFEEVRVDDNEQKSSENDEKLEKIKQANELAQKKKRKIASFILEHPDTEEMEVPDDDDEYAEEFIGDEDAPIDLDDENVIRDRLTRSLKGLISRLVILGVLFGVTLFIAITNKLNVNLGSLTKFVNSTFSTQNYLYTHLTIGILSFAACSSVVSNGLVRLIKLRPDADTLCALAHVTSIAAIIPYLMNSEYIQIPGLSQVYLMISLGALICNTLSKLFTVKTAQRNFTFTFADKPRYFIERCSDRSAERLAKGTAAGRPAVCSIRKTEMLCDFIISTYCEDASDRLCRKTVPVTIGAALVCAAAAFFISANDTEYIVNRINWALTVLTAVFSIGASFSGSMMVTLPLLAASRGNDKRGSAILGYNAVAELSETNAALIEAKTLFPADSIKITNICGYDKPKNSSEGKINIDEAIILAASLAVASDSVLADAFFGMLNHKRELLKEVNGCVYENNLGVMGWIDRRRVLLGNRRHMKSHEITVPNMKKEAAANVNNDEVIYLAVGGEVCLLFFVDLNANAEVKRSVQGLTDSGVTLVIKTVDGMITDNEIADLFDIDKGMVRILPFETHESFVENTKFASKGSAAVNCDGTFVSFAETIRQTRIIHAKTTLAGIVQLGGMALGGLLALIFTLFGNYGAFNMLILLIYNVVTGAAAVGTTFIKRK